MGLWLWPWNKSPFFIMDVAWVSTSEEFTAKSEHCQVHVNGFFYHEGVVHDEYAPPGQTVTKEYYVNVLRWLRDAVRRKWPQLWASGDWRLCHDNVPAHSSAQICECDGHSTQGQSTVSHCWLTSHTGECSHMHNKVSCNWLWSYIKAIQLVLKIFKVAGYFLDRPCTIEIVTLILKLIMCYKENVRMIR